MNINESVATRRQLVSEIQSNRRQKDDRCVLFLSTYIMVMYIVSINIIKSESLIAYGGIV